MQILKKLIFPIPLFLLFIHRIVKSVPVFKYFAQYDSLLPHGIKLFLQKLNFYLLTLLFNTDLNFI